MKKKLAFVICFIFTFFNCLSQSNQTAIKYDISRFTFLTTIGGSLTIDDNQSRCAKNLGTIQNLFQSAISATIFIDINNRSGGNSCATLIVETTSGTIETEILENSQSGVLRFNKVKKAYLTIGDLPQDRAIQKATAVGIATIWF